MKRKSKKSQQQIDDIRQRLTLYAQHTTTFSRNSVFDMAMGMRSLARILLGDESPTFQFLDNLIDNFDDFYKRATEGSCKEVDQ